MTSASSDSGGTLEGAPILVVEDHPASGRMLAAVLTAAGAVVTTVDTAEKAVAVARATPPRVAVVDLVLPGAGGLTLVEALKAAPETRAVVCIAVTVMNGEELERSARAAGCAAYVRKPIDTETFAALVARLLEEAP